MKFHYILLFFCYCLSLSLQEANGHTIYRIYLKDKGKSSYSLNKPDEFLSPKSVQRRQKQGIALDQSDLPIDTAYLRQIENTGAPIRVVSKWLKTVTVDVDQPEILSALYSLSFVDSIQLVWKGADFKSDRESNNEPDTFSVRSSPNTYGDAFPQIQMHQGDLLHEVGFRGKGMTIAVIDGGFSNYDRIIAFNQSQIKGFYDISGTLSDKTLENNADHGTKVLSCMLSNMPGYYIGTAPEADYYLISTEVLGSEYPVEEDFWVAGVEYADSLGVDVINTSLGYALFDDSTMNHKISELDGKTVPISLAAGMASDKGILLFVAAGNEGRKPWGKITFPADSHEVMTVGSVDQEKERSAFSSVGLISDGYVKPDIMALGSAIAVINSYGAVETSSGTSFSSPVITGLAACLWQALPDYTNKKIMELLREYSDRHLHPDTLYGWGIPNVYRIYTAAQPSGIRQVEKDPEFLYASPQGDRLFVNLQSANDYKNCKLFLFSVWGAKVMERFGLTESVNTASLAKGIYIASLNVNGKRYIRKFIKY